MRPPVPLLAPLIVLLTAPPILSQECTNPVPGIGIGRFLCHSGTCLVNVRRGDEVVHDFTVEPEVVEIIEGTPAADQLRVGDIVVSIDGVLVTTPEGGRRLSEFTSGRSVVLGIRREGSNLAVTLVPEYGCRRPALTVRGGADQPRTTPVPAVPDDAAPRVSFGLRIDCPLCGWVEDRGRRLFRAPGPILVSGVTEGGPGADAGLAAGDVLLSVDGHALGSAEAARRLGEVEAGERVRMGVRRGERQFEVTLVPIAETGRLL